VSIQISLCSSLHSFYVHSHRHTSCFRMVYLARVTTSHSHRHTSSSGWLPGQSHICLSPRSFKLLTATPPLQDGLPGWRPLRSHRHTSSSGCLLDKSSLTGVFTHSYSHCHTSSSGWSTWPETTSTSLPRSRGYFPIMFGIETHAHPQPCCALARWFGSFGLARALWLYSLFSQ